MRGARAAIAFVLGGALAGGCATPSTPMLGRADEQMAAARYRDAMQLYEAFLRANPDHPAAVRARAAQGALDKLLAAEAETARLRAALAEREAETAQLRQELMTRRTEGAERNTDLQRARRDLDAQKAEVERLKGDLDRLRSIDLRREAPRR
jgi:septal ring factor EnvC (AmiA/AmiB activator)